MKIILLKSVPKVGQKYEVKTVSDGYALNFLIPQKAAEVATSAAIKKVELLKAQESAEKKVQEDLLAKNLESIAEVTIEFAEKASDKGHLFSSIHKEQIVEQLKAQARLNVAPDFIELAKPIKEIGEHKVLVKALDKSAELKVVVKKA